ncbi:hypothetical protein OTK49_00555 [Vibrio coralliirubri]|uniref:hypothetical protein n=1 Tax=Vibrio coralliirubri TaxID=1516159 RepID=UPI0022833600|nr:hypothetical protein [Vibrio coralliirubri]MCY9861032.1 hypothetical protein [Vibrio coralliirubri]
MSDLSTIYDNKAIAKLDPVINMAEIFKLTDLDWKYEVKPLLFYGNDGALIISDGKQLLINRNGELEQIAIRGKDFKVTTAKELYSVFLALRDPLDLGLYAMGHTRGGKFLYIVCELHQNRIKLNDQANFKTCLFIYTVNDGNGKTKFAPIMLKNGEPEYQVSVIGGTDEAGKPKYSSTCYELSHHYQFDHLEAATAVKMSVEEHLSDFDEKMEIFGCVEATSERVNEFHHLLYRRFEIGNEKTKKDYDKVMAELATHYEQFNASLPIELSGTLAGLYLSLVAYLDRFKKRKSGKEGRITSINFTHDNVTKRAAFEELTKISLKSMAQK